MMKVLKLFLMFTFVSVPTVATSAMLKIFVEEQPTQVTIFFNAKDEKTFVIHPDKPQSFHRFFGGFKKIQWVDPLTGIFYEAELNIKFSLVKYTLHIKGKRILLEYNAQIKQIFGTPIR